MDLIDTFSEATQDADAEIKNRRIEKACVFCAKREILMFVSNVKR